MIKSTIKRALVWALTAESRAVLRKYKPKIVAVTGSVGKTSTKDAIFVAVASLARARKSHKSFNSELGVPLTILGIEKSGWDDPLAWLSQLLRGLELILFTMPYPEWLVLEVGVDRPGDMLAITRWLAPDIAVFTRMGTVPVHVEYFKDRQAVVDEKGLLVAALKPGGAAILNADDPDVLAVRSRTAERVVTFGASEEADFRITHPKIVYDERKMPTGIAFGVTHDGSSESLVVAGTIALHHEYPLAAALAVGTILGGSPKALASALGAYAIPPGRGTLVSGMKGSLIVDDTYNASPTAVEAALEALKETRVPGQKIAVLGDMLELGKYSAEEHRRLGALAAETCDTLIAIGLRASSMAEEAEKAGMKEGQVHAFAERGAAVDYLLAHLGKGDIVLIKGSQGMRLEKVIEAVMAHPEDKERLLVRQEPEWQRR